MHWKNIGDEDYAKESINSFYRVDRQMMRGVIDIEGLKGLVQQRRLPILYGSGHTPVGALIFCPYQYVINPGMRETLEIETEGSIIIVDEAHNIEDTCREAGSIEISLFTVMKVNKDLCISHAHFASPAHPGSMEREAGAEIFLMKIFERVSVGWLTREKLSQRAQRMLQRKRLRVVVILIPAEAILETWWGLT